MKIEYLPKNWSGDMRNPLRKRFKREINKNKGRYLSIFLLMTLTIILGSGFLVAADSSKYTMEQDWVKNKVEDGQFTSLYEMDDAVLQRIREKDVKIEKQFYKEFTLDKEQGLSLRVYRNRESINKASIHEGRLPKAEQEIAVDRLFAANVGITIGDQIKLLNKNYQVVGTISIPDYSSLFKTNNTMVMDALHFGIGVVDEEAFNQFSKDGIVYNYAYYYQDRNITDDSRAKKNNEIKLSLAQSSMLSSFLAGEDNQARSFCKEDFGGDIPMMRALLFIMITIMAFVFAILTNSTIDEESAIIGTLRANGYTKREMITHYVSLPVLITFLSAIVGNLFGYVYMAKVFSKIYYNTYSLAPLNMRFNTEAFVLTTVVPILIMIFVNYLMLRRKLSMSPLRFLRKDLKKSTNRKPIKLPNWKFIRRFQIRIIIQNLGVYITLFVGIFFASFLLLFGLGILPIVENYVRTVDETMLSNYQYVLKAPVNNKDGERITITKFHTYYKLGNRDVDVTVFGLPDDSKYFDSASLPEDDTVAIGSGFASKLNIKTDDIINFTDSFDSGKKYHMKVSKVKDYNAGYAIFMKQDKLNLLMKKEKDYYNGYLSNQELSINSSYLAMTVTKDDMTNAADQMTASMGNMMFLIQVFSVLIFLVLMYILTKVVIDKNAIAISFMKVFGYESKEIRRLYLNASTFTVIASLILCIPLEIQLMKLIMVYAFSKLEGYLPFYLSGYIIIQVVFTGIISYLIINFRHINKVNRIHMSDALKNRE